MSEIGNERFGPQGGHWGAQIDLIGSITDHILEAKGDQLFDAIGTLNLEQSGHVIWELASRIRMERMRKEEGGDENPVVQD